ncbi:MAG: hypothetical protein LBG79_00355 [Spirochaetaceae bacterium]|jgi:hypothetical protein|nr:hypothetical protein [Spirochaetaceae bacterium]
MTPEKRQEYEAFVKIAWAAAVNHKPGAGEIPKNEFIFLKEPNGMWHITGAQPARHIYKQHGNVRTETMRGQIAVTEKDFLLIPDIISDYSYSVENIKYLNKNSVLYAKHDDEGTHIYIEQISNKRRRKTTATFFKLAKQREAQNLLTILGNNANYDIKNAKIIGLGRGGNPPDTTGHVTRRTVATSVNPADTS